MTPERKWTKEGIEAYLASHPDATVREMRKSMGVSRQRVYRILKSFDIKLPGTTETMPTKKANLHSQASHIRQNLAEPSRNGTLDTKSHTKLILMSPCSNGQLVEAIKNGATPYLAREMAVEEAGQLTHPGNFMQVSALKGSLYRLTKQEVEILQHIANGNTYSQIGGALGISVQTVKNHMTTIMRKLGANNKAHATALALRYGFLSLSEVIPSQTIKQANATKEAIERGKGINQT